jgi:hypothetical protein
MSTLNHFWRALESTPGLAASAWEWRRRLGSDHHVASPFLRATGQHVDCLPMDEGDPHNVLVHSRDKVIAVAPNANETTRLTVEDVAVHALHAGALRKALAEALALRTSTTVIGRIDEFRVGTWQPQPSTSFPVLFIAKPDAEAYAVAFRSLVETSIGPAIVLVPTIEHCGDELLERAKRQSILAVPLLDCIHLEDSSLQSSDQWQAHLGAFCQLSNVKLPSSFSNKRPKRKRASRTADIEAIKKELVEEIRSRRGQLRHAEDVGLDLQLPKRPTKAEIGRRAGLQPYAVSRCFSDSDASELARLYGMLESVEDVLRFGR